MTRLIKQAWRRLRRPVVLRRRRQAGIALIVVTVTIAVLGAVVGDFSFNARVDLEAAANARDTLRAEYLARSGMQLSRLLIKVQQSVLDKNRQFVGDIQIADFAPYLMKAFGGESDERAGLGALLGIDVSQMKGLGVGKNATFDVTMTSDDGRINLNCGGGLNPNQQQAQALYGLLSALFWPPRSTIRRGASGAGPTPTGRSRSATTPRAPSSIGPTSTSRSSCPPRCCRVDSRRRRRAAGPRPTTTTAPRIRTRHTTTSTTRSRSSTSCAAWATTSGAPSASCSPSTAAARSTSAPSRRRSGRIMAAIIRYAAKDPTSPVLLDDLQVAAIAQKILGLMQMTGGAVVSNVNQLVNFINNPEQAMQNMATGNSSANNSASSSGGSGRARSASSSIQPRPTR